MANPRSAQSRSRLFTPLVSTVTLAALLLGAADDAPPATQPERDTLAGRLQALQERPDDELDDKDRATVVALQFIIAIGENDPNEAAGLLDVVGYQRLPLSGKLDTIPERPLQPADLVETLQRYEFNPIGDVDLEAVALHNRRSLERWFPAVARWMGPQDYALRMRGRDEGGISWLKQRGCIVVRVRGDKATVVGGNLFAALRL